MATFIDGVGASENIDSSGERISIAGLDDSSLALDGVFNWEHHKDIPAQIVGKVLKSKKIFSEKDCEDERQLYYWNKILTPYLYVMGELFDDYKESAKEVAGMFRYDADKKGQNERNVMNFSIEGAKIDKQGMDIIRSIARKVTITVLPCNKAAVAEMVPSPEAAKAGKDDFSSIFKTEPQIEIELFKTEGKANIILPQVDMKKAADALGLEPMTKNVIPFKKPGAAAPMAPKAPAQAATGKPNWSEGKTQGAAMHFSHPEHGTLSVHKQPTGEFHVKHNGAMAGVGQQKGSFATASEAGSHVKNYMNALKSKKVLGHQMSNISSLGKTLEAGMGNASPGQLSGGAVLQKEDILSSTVAGDRIKRAAAHIHRGDKLSHKIALEGAKEAHKEKLGKIKAAPKPNLGKSELEKGGEKSPSLGKVKQKGTFNQKGVHMPHLSSAGGGESVMGSHIRKPDNTGSGSKEMARRHAASNLKDLKSMPKPDLGKSEWLERAEEEYNNWDKKESFLAFMKKKMPNLAKGEIDAIGRTLALKKSLDAEETLSRLISKVDKKPTE